MLACTGTIASAQDNGDKTPYQTKSLANDAIKDVFVKTSGGSITVSGAGESPRIEVYVRGNNGQELSKEEIAKRLSEDYTLDISVNNHELHATAKNKHDGGFNWRRQLSISFKIYTPRAVDTHLNTSGGSIHLDNLTGHEEFSTSGGSLHMKSLAGVIKGETSGGSIEISDSKDDISLETSGGSVRASNCQGKIKLGTSGGSLHFDNLKGTIHAETSGGSINGNDIEGELVTGTSGGSVNLTNMACSLDASTSGGGMHVAITRLGKYVKLESSGGHVDLKLPDGQGINLDLSASRISKLTLSKFSGEWGKDHVKGTINGGGVPVKVDASDSLNLSFN